MRRKSEWMTLPQPTTATSSGMLRPASRIARSTFTSSMLFGARLERVSSRSRLIVNFSVLTLASFAHVGGGGRSPAPCTMNKDP